MTGGGSGSRSGSGSGGGPGKTGAYGSAGVDIDAKQKGLARVKELARATFTPGVLGEIGSFGGLFRPELAGLREPVLVASADGVGTKLTVARLAGDYSTVGRDLVNHCVNDILVQGALPLFFLDYVGAGVLAPDRMVELVGGVAQGCRENGCALLGGETAEMPGFYQPGDYELVGFIVGLVDRPHLLDGSRAVAGSVLVGLAAAGLHTNGYSLARRILFDKLGLRCDDRAPWASGQRVGQALLAPHLSYLAPLAPLLRHPALRAMAHVTGGGLTDNLPRVLPAGTHAEIRVGSWEVPQVFHFLQQHGDVETEEMLRVFNMGIGMVLVVDPAGLREVLGELRRAKQRAWTIGTVQAGGAGVVYDLGPLPGALPGAEGSGAAAGEDPEAGPAATAPADGSA
ncbi:MAG TPA: phosphoribosylformylglycinamidine cyclo-ligase [Thermoanaerobaculia bacterium]|nr:phosphoribosylformylglycinamidine cyclo-ligase [Thermoanaerobaculia bacterium]